jgi:hypothetical protein
MSNFAIRKPRTHATYSKICVARNHANACICGKVTDPGNVCMLTGYTDKHTGGVDRLTKLQNYRIMTSRDITWLHKTWGDYRGITMQRVITITDDNNDNIEREIESETTIIQFRKRMSQNLKRRAQNLQNQTVIQIDLATRNNKHYQKKELNCTVQWRNLNIL